MTDTVTYEKAGRAACHAANYCSSAEDCDTRFEKEKPYWCDVAQAAIEAHNETEDQEGK